ncbi:hypothetical protein DNHGIG_39490 [Collibacillus ludicampi]|uniref:Class IIb bacteriocin, lactobin A/cerein 7B family n=1 Tax=Collibacillus ludicampi TaxID=2771369 RepID=A0AAV4LL28_9BACL|nr:hypothetical protein [Collibacillus ludicampi]GIM48400.1 hypothetical protein DNHGIG_39490 [Collibacillus ludicampi]
MTELTLNEQLQINGGSSYLTDFLVDVGAGATLGFMAAGPLGAVGGAILGGEIWAGAYAADQGW